MEDLRKRAENAKYYFYSFSGGRDSAFAMYLTVDKFRNMGKEIAAIFVDNGDEFPDLVEHVKKVCDSLNVKLIILHGDDFVTRSAANQFGGAFFLPRKAVFRMG